MPFDPWNVDAHHEKVRQRIAAGEPGLAQSVVGDILVSYEMGGSITHGPVLNRSMTSVLDEMILDVARGEGIAGPKTFDQFRVHFAIKNRRAYPDHWVKMHKEADDIETFYSSPEGKTKVL